LLNNLDALTNKQFTTDELNAIEGILAD